MCLFSTHYHHTISEHQHIALDCANRCLLPLRCGELSKRSSSLCPALQHNHPLLNLLGLFGGTGRRRRRRSIWIIYSQCRIWCILLPTIICRQRRTNSGQRYRPGGICADSGVSVAIASSLVVPQGDPPCLPLSSVEGHWSRRKECDKWL